MADFFRTDDGGPAQPTLFWGIGGGSDVSTCELLRYVQAAGAGRAAEGSRVVLSLGAKYAASGQYDAGAVRASAAKRGFVSAAALPEPERRRLWEGMPPADGAALWGDVFEHDLVFVQGDAAAGAIGVVIDMREHAERLVRVIRWVLGVGTAAPRRVVAVDTGGDALASFFMERAEEDLYLAPLGGGGGAEQEDAHGGDPFCARAGLVGQAEAGAGAALLVKAGAHYVPVGRGIGDYSPHQYGAANEARDEWTLALLGRACGGAMQWELAVVGVGVDGESSIAGLRHAERWIRATYGMKAEVVLAEGAPGAAELFAAGMEALDAWREPEVHRTLWFIRKAVAYRADGAPPAPLTPRAAACYEPDAGGRDCYRAAPASDGGPPAPLVCGWRGARLSRRRGAPRAAWPCAVPVAFARQVWLFDDAHCRGILTDLMARVAAATVTP